jgi:anaerobic selenocysteine-containing dehydrogenase
VAVFVGKNPWQSHGFPRARPILKEIARDPDRALIVIDPRRTETADLADHHLQVKPGTDAFCLGVEWGACWMDDDHEVEKWEATFFNLAFPENAFQLRAPLLDPLLGTLPEVEIHARLVRAMGGYADDDDVAALRAAAEQGRAAFADAFLVTTAGRPELSSLAPLLLYEALGPTLGEGRQGAAAWWGLAHQCALAYPDSVRRAGFQGEGLELGEALFEAVLNGRSGVIFTVDDYEESWRRLATADGLVNLAVPELLEEFAGLELESAEERAVVDAYPFVLSAGERRYSTATPSSATPPGARRVTAPGHCACIPTTPRRSGWSREAGCGSPRSGRRSRRWWN